MSERLTSGTECGFSVPTPNARDWKDSGVKQGNRKSVNLGTWAARFPTPVASDTYHRRGKYKQGGTALSTAVGGKLNPSWVEWLMGWPVGWTDLRQLETGKSHKQQP